MRNLLTKSLGILLLGLSLTACNYFDLDEVEPIDSVPSDAAIIDFQTSLTARAGIYALMQLGANFDGYLASWQYFSDECDFTGTFPTRAEFGDLSVSPSNTTLAGFFTDFYQISNAANTFIDELPRITDDPGLTPELVNTLLGEARFARGLAYFYLVQGWQDVPLVLNPTRTAGPELNVPKSSVVDVMAQVKSDLEFAAANIGAGSLGLTAATANALLARIALYEGRDADAMSLAMSAVGTDYDLTNFGYLEDRIFYLDFSATDGNSLAFFYGTAALNGRHSIEPSQTLIDAYEEGDLRFDASIGFTGSTPYGNKYDDFASSSGAQNDPIYLFRGAEQVLIVAEAAARMGDFTTANDWFNQVRRRAGLAELTLDAGNFEDLILQERFVELAMEGGHRLWDLRRTGRALDVLGPIGYEACDDVWPLPLREIDRNVNLEQNDCCNC